MAATRRVFVPLASDRCAHCQADRHLIVGDGRPVCAMCIALLTEAAGDPMAVGPELRTVLRDAHADIVSLGETDAGAPTWKWTGWA